MHASAKAGLTPEEMLARQAAVFKAVKDARVAARRHVRRDESTVDTVIEWRGSIAFGVTGKTVLIASKPSAGTKSITVVYKGGAA